MAVPSLLLCALAAGEIFLATRRYWFAAGALAAHATTMRWACWISMAALVLLTLSGRARRLAVDHLERTGRLSPVRRAAWLGVAYLGIFSLLFFIKYCQYRGCILTQDAAATANIAYNFIHHWTLECSVLGVASYLSVHFMPVIALWSPCMLLGHGIMPLLILQTLLVASIPIAAFLLAWRRSGTSLAGWAALWLVFTSPFFFELASADILAQMAFPALFLWGIYFAEAGRWKLATVCGLLLALTIEQSGLLFFGLGLFLIIKAGLRARRAWRVGAVVCAGAILLWYLEMRIIRSSAEGRIFNSWYWNVYFGNLAPSPAGLCQRALTEPIALARQVFWPMSNLMPAWKLVLSTGFLCLLAPAELAAWAVTFLPHLVSNPGCYYHDLRLQYSAYATGPLWWALAAGVAWFCRKLEPTRFKALALVAMLGFGALNLGRSPGIFVPGWSDALQDEVPALAARIPSGASVWASEPAAPWVSCRKFLKIIPSNIDTPYFSRRQFVPDYILLERQLFERYMEPRSRDRLLTFLAREGYVKADEALFLILLKHPRAPLAQREGRPPALVIPEPAPDAASYRKYTDSFTDQAEVIRYLRPAAEHGEAVAQHYLAVFSAGLFGGSQDMAEAVKWFRKSAEGGNTIDEYNLGMFLARGVGTRRDEAEAKVWLRRAAAHGVDAAGTALERLERR